MKELKDMSLEELWELFPIILRKHNPNYKVWYSEERASLSDILCDFNIYRINHIGSTAVDDLTAKPIVDILLELYENYDMDAAAFRLQNNGWILMGRDETQKTLDLNKGYTTSGFSEKVYHLHVKIAGDWGELYFRDYLRSKPDVAMEYERLKKSLSVKFEHNRDAYTNAKSAFVSENTGKARKEYAGRYTPCIKE